MFWDGKGRVEVVVFCTTELSNEKPPDDQRV
jgi:hypothetical protein